MNDMKIPDRFKPLLGIRQFLVTPGGIVISPNREGYVWDTDWKVAECSDGHRWKRKEEPHVSPDDACCCGIQVGYDLASLWKEGTIRGNMNCLDERNRGVRITFWDLAGAEYGVCHAVYGLVAASGNIRKFENLMKAERVKIIGFVVPPEKYHKPYTLTDLSDMINLAARYDAYTVNLKYLDDITPDVMRLYAPMVNCDYWHPDDRPLNFS